MKAYLAKKIIAFVLTVSILLPFPYVLILPEYAFAQTPPTQQGGGGSWGQAAASGAVSLAGCLLAGQSILGSFFGSVNWSSFSPSGVISSVLGSSPIPIPKTITSIIDELPVNPVTGALEVPVNDKSLNSKADDILKNQDTQIGLQKKQLNLQLGAMTKKDVLDCIGWALAKLIWRQIAASIVDWINGGFNGKPAFIQDFNRFMLGVADQVAGQIIQGSALSFLCSPFSLNIRIALATRYSQRAPSCTLSQVIKNIQGFMNNFSEGGWSSWLQFTTVPQNNPYGGYMIGEATVQLNINKQQLSFDKQLGWGSGFLSVTSQQCKDAQVAAGPNVPPQSIKECSGQIQTPGALIAHKIGTTIDSPETSLLLADDLNKIIDALSQQLITKALSGFNSLSQSNSYSDDYNRYGPQNGGNIDVTGFDGSISTTTGIVFDNNRNAFYFGPSTSTPDRVNPPFVYPTSGSAPFTTGFYVLDPLDQTIYGLDFGDGTGTTTWASPCETLDGGNCIATMHTYDAAGTYTARLTSQPTSASCPAGAACNTVAVRVISTATITVAGSNTGDTGSLTADTTSGLPPLGVTFNYTLPDSGLYEIQFGDNTNYLYPVPTSCLAAGNCQVTHSYTAPGTYTAYLVGAGPCPQSNLPNSVTTCQRAMLGSVTINVGNIPLSTNLTANPTSGNPPLTVQFQTPTAPPGAYHVDFDDGSAPAPTVVQPPCSPGFICNASVQSLPVHTYNTPGVYTAKLRSDLPCGGTDCSLVGSVHITVNGTVTNPDNGDGGANPTSLISLINQAIQTEQSIQSNLNEAENSLATTELNVNDLVSCWVGKLNPSSSTYLKDGGDRTQASIQKMNAQFTKQSLEDRRVAYAARLTTAGAHITQMQTLIDRAQQTQDASVLATITQQFNDGKAAGSFGSASSLASVRTELASLRVEMYQTNQLIGGQTDSCYFFPNNPPN